MLYLLSLSGIILIPLVFAYAWGMAEYSVMNRKTKPDQIKYLKGTLMDEVQEFRDAVRQRKPIDSILEGFDVIHSIIKLIIAYISLRALERPEIWLLVFPLIFPVGIKHGYRFMKYNCIRNHTNKRNLDHNCSYINELY